MAAEILIRGLETTDHDSAVELFLQPRCIWGTLRLPHDSRDDLRKRLENPDGNRHSIVAVTDGRVVGLVTLVRSAGRRAHAGAIGMFVHDDFQGQGIGRRLLDACIDLAENWLGLTRIELDVFTDNVPAIALYERCGFEREGTARHYALREGVLVDAFFMARVKRSA